MVKRIEYSDGTVEYRNKNDNLHREDGPALILSDGSKYWYKNGEIHREDGPAIIYSDGTKEWWSNGGEYSFNEWIQLVNITEEEKMELVLYHG